MQRRRICMNTNVNELSWQIWCYISVLTLNKNAFRLLFINCQLLISLKRYYVKMGTHFDHQSSYISFCQFRFHIIIETIFSKFIAFFSLMKINHTSPLMSPSSSPTMCAVKLFVSCLVPSTALPPKILLKRPGSWNDDLMFDVGWGKIAIWFHDINCCCCWICSVTCLGIKFGNSNKQNNWIIRKKHMVQIQIQ